LDNIFNKVNGKGFRKKWWKRLIHSTVRFYDNL